VHEPGGVSEADDAVELACFVAPILGTC